MHAVLFSQKHAYLVSLAKQREWLRGFGITPARYELLVVIAQTNAWLKKVHFVHQSQIWQQLGVTSVTVSKMLKALEKLGFVRRERSCGDKRQVNVELTRKARSMLRRVHEVWIKPGYVWLAIHSAFAISNHDIGAFIAHLDTLREMWKDRATFFYPWFFPSKRRQRKLLEPSSPA